VGGSGIEKLAYRAFAFVMRRPLLYEIVTRFARWMAPSKGGWTSRLPGGIAPGPLKAWLSQRDLPMPAPQSFRELWRLR
jgi:L-lactate dehydrogenase complex protein LldF